MAIEKKDLPVGTKLVAKYKKDVYKAEVVQTEEGVRYRLEDGRAFTSLSGAGSAVRDGKSTNGWSFWSVETEGEPGQPVGTKTETSKRSNGVIRRTPNQKGAPEGQVRYFCSACLDSFYAQEGETPSACPKGHDESFGAIKSAFEAPEQEAEVEQEAQESVTE